MTAFNRANLLLAGWWRAGLETALDAIYPPRCAGCRAWGKPLFCDACRGAIQPLVPPFCARCGIPFDPLALAADICADCRSNRYHREPPFGLLRSVYIFDGPMRDAMHRFKYQEKTALDEPFAALLADYLRQPPAAYPAIPLDAIALVCPVPLHPWRRYRRGYNQSLLLSRALGRDLGLPAAEILKRTRYTSTQVGLSRVSRATNVRGAFGVQKDKLERINPQMGAVLLVDDVCTTSATLRECAVVLKAAGVPEVYAVTLARQL